MRAVPMRSVSIHVRSGIRRKIHYCRFTALLSVLLFAPAALAGTILYSPTSTLTQVEFAEPSGQSFIAQDSLVEAGLNFASMNPASSSSDPIEYGLYECLGTSGSLVGSATFTLADSFDGFYLVDFSATALTVGNTYSLVASIVGSSTYWGMRGTSDAPDGTGIQFGIASTAERALLVRPLVSVPEPSILVLLSAGLLGLFLKNRRAT
jgi:PEP-CTERM motif-containing protein